MVMIAFVLTKGLVVDYVCKFEILYQVEYYTLEFFLSKATS